MMGELEVKLILYPVGTFHLLAHSWSTSEFELFEQFDWHLVRLEAETATASTELNDFFLGEMSGLRVVLVVRVA